MPKRKSASGTPTQTTPPVSAAPTEARLKPSFPVAIGKTYFRQGFFNVPMDFERYFAGDGSIVFITLPGRPQPTEAKISRRANRTDAPRVMGGARVRDWLQQNLRVGEKIRVIVHGPKEIEIKKV